MTACLAPRAAQRGSDAVFSIDGRLLGRLLKIGCLRVIAQREALNRINVFPVPDGDTGSNLSFTLRSVLSALRFNRERHVGEVLRRIAEEAIDGARGNSGAILAQFLQGLAEALVDRDRLGASELATGTDHGSRQARLAMSEPKEGTILSVIAAFSQELHEQARRGVEDLRTLFDHGLARARVALAATPTQLAVLREAGVVDAGAQGFVDLLEGIAEYLRDGRRSLKADRAAASATPSKEHNALAEVGGYEESSQHRYCTECLISAEAVDRDALRASIIALGCSSLVIAGTRGKVRVHAHVDAPEALFEAASLYGSVTRRKADDMWAQTRSARQSGSVAVVTDSAADIPEHEIERLNIHVVPVRLSFGEEDYLDKVSLSPQQFYERLEHCSVPPKTSQPPPGDFRRQYEFLLAHHPRVISVHLSRVLSGTLQSAESAAARVDAARARVFDARNASVGLGLLAMYAAEAAVAGLDCEQIVTVLERMRPRTLTFAVIPDLSFGVRGGRVPPLVRFIAEVLRLTPIVRANAEGRLAAAGGLLGRGRLAERFAAKVLRALPRDRPLRVLIGHCNDPVGAARIESCLSRDLPRGSRIDVLPAGSAIAAHAGPGTLVVAGQPMIPPLELLGATAT